MLNFKMLLNNLEKIGLSKRTLFLLFSLFLLIVFYFSGTGFYETEKNLIQEISLKEQIVSASNKDLNKNKDVIEQKIETKNLRNIFDVPYSSEKDDKVNNKVNDLKNLKNNNTSLRPLKMEQVIENKPVIYLSGVASSQNKAALAVINSGNDSKICAVGDVAFGFKVTEIKEKSVKLVGEDGQILVLDLFTKKASKESENVGKTKKNTEINK